jgi:DNA-binding GntR family transcriptional regulator
MVFTHRFNPGAHINVEKLCQDLGVSRTPVIRALRRLEKDGLVRHEANRGYLMTEMTLPMAVQLYQVREILETEAGRLAASLIGSDTLERLEKILEEQRPLVEQGNLLRYSESDFQFHQEIYRASDNWMLIEVLNLVKTRSRPLTVDITPLLGELYQAHQEIFKALRSRDAEASARLMGEHTVSVRRLIESKLASSPWEAAGDKLGREGQTNPLSREVSSYGA